jgi:hypothetical protein
LDKAKNFVEDSSKSPHLVRGSNVHKALENYIIKKRAGEQNIAPSSLPEVERTKPLIDNLMAIYDVHPELQLAINENFEAVDWFSKDAWFRAIYDMIGFGPNLFFGDFKTGKLADYSGSLDMPGQLHLSSLMGMAVWPDYDEIDNRYIYVDHKQTKILKLTRSEHFEPLKEKLVLEHRQVNEEKNFDPKSNEFCKWCQATKDQCPNSRKAVLPGK